MTTALLRPDVTVETADVGPLKVDGGWIELDSSVVPYASAQIDIPLTADTSLEGFDPRDNVRVVVEASAAAETTSRSFDLGLRERTVNHEAKVVTIKLASDEALLLDYATLTLDSGARAKQNSVRAVVNYVLARIGAALASGGPDADVTAYWQVTNLFPDPSAENATVAWSPDVASPNIVRDGSTYAPPFEGSYLLRVQATSTSPLSIGQTLPVGVTQGKTYTAALYLRSYAGNTKNARVTIRWTGPTGNFIRDTQGAYAMTPSSKWNRYVVTAPAPPGATGARLFIDWSGTHSVGNLHFVDGIMFHEGNEAIPFYTGSTPANAHYSYSWARDVNGSASTREPVIERSPELFTWKPGTSAWDYLQPLITSVGLRLFCDEKRVWRLIDPADYSVAGLLSVSPANATESGDTITREDAEIFATGVVARYVWRDDLDIDQVAFDSAGTPQKVYVRDFPHPYPGPGAAAAILARRLGTGRTQDVVTLPQWTATPGMVVSITMPSTVEQQGKLSAVRFSLDDDALMSLGTRGLIDIPEDSWFAVDPSEAWTDPPDITWNQWV